MTKVMRLVKKVQATKNGRFLSSSLLPTFINAKVFGIPFQAYTTALSCITDLTFENMNVIRQGR